MREIILYIATSLDGKIAGTDHSLDWLPQPGEDNNDYGYSEMYDSIDTVLMGYTTYEISMGFGDWPYKGKTAYVFTMDKNKPCVDEASLITESPVDFCKTLKQDAGKNIWLIGGGSINRQLHDAGLIDKYIITIVPHILGNGIEMFPGISTEVKLELYKQQTYDNGLAMMYYKKHL